MDAACLKLTIRRARRWFHCTFILSLAPCTTVRMDAVGSERETEIEGDAVYVNSTKQSEFEKMSPNEISAATYHHRISQPSKIGPCSYAARVGSGYSVVADRSGRITFPTYCRSMQGGNHRSLSHRAGRRGGSTDDEDIHIRTQIASGCIYSPFTDRSLLENMEHVSQFSKLFSPIKSLTPPVHHDALSESSCSGWRL